MQKYSLCQGRNLGRVTTDASSLATLSIYFIFRRGLLSISYDRETVATNNQEKSLVSESLIFTTFHPFNRSVHA